MTVVAAILAGAVAGAAALHLLRSVLGLPALARENHRGVTVPTAGGLVVVAAVLGVVAAWTGLDVVRDELDDGARLATIGLVAGFALLGLADDVLGSGADGRGFAGHLRALRQGRLTTGGLKLFGGAALALIVVAAAGETDVALLFVDAVLVALAANLANLLDRAPGRTTKVTVAAVAVLVLATGFDRRLVAVAVVAGALAATLWADLREQVMLGDTGANVAGAVAGFGLVLTAAEPVRVAALVVVAGLNVASEVVSFSAVIDRVPPLRWLDRLGRRPVT